MTKDAVPGLKIIMAWNFDEKKELQDQRKFTVLIKKQTKNNMKFDEEKVVHKSINL